MPSENQRSPIADQEPVIEFRHASYQLPSGQTLLSDLNLSVPRGETVALLGRSGAGKSTALKLINRMLEPTSGEVRVNGRSTLDWNPITLRRQIGYVIQDVGLFPHYTVEENIALLPRMERWPEERVRERVGHLLALVGLRCDEYSDRYPHELSGGQRQRVGIARALAADPPILLMDEPFGALDPLTRAEVQCEFQEVQQNLRKTIVIVTHHVGEALLSGDADRRARCGQARRSLFAQGILQCDRARGGCVCRKSANVRRRGEEIMNLLEFFVRHHREILQSTVEHVWLVGIAMLIASCRGNSAGRAGCASSVAFDADSGRRQHRRNHSEPRAVRVFAADSLARRPRRPTGHHRACALRAAPHNSQHRRGNFRVDAPVREAARGMGLTDTQILMKIEFPLAFSTILAGVRVATVLTIGIATIAAAVGAGGLGEFIFRGLAMVNNQLILAGAIPAALLALAADFFLGILERRLRPVRA